MTLPRSAAHGAGSLAVLMVLLLGATLLMLYLNRALLFEQRAAAHGVRAAQAEAAADAGLAWALALLNHPGRIDATCQPVTGAAPGERFATRYLVSDDAGLLTPATAARPGCVATNATPPGWACACPTAGSAAPSTPADGSEAPAFGVHFSAGPRAGTVRIAIDGCSHAGGPCTNGTRADATVRIQHLLAPLGAAPRTPYAALTARGAVTLQGAVEVVHTVPPAITVSSAGAIATENTVRLVVAPGAVPAQSLLAQDATWLDPTTGQPLPATRWFAHHFALARSTYRALPTVRVLACSACTGSEVTAAYADGARVLWVDGSLTLSSPDTLGSASDPLLLIVTGSLNASAATVVHGLVHAGDVAWAAGAGAQAQVHGALLSEGAVHLSGRVLVRHDGAVLNRLRHATGLFVPLAGAWRDFGD